MKTQPTAELPGSNRNSYTYDPMFGDDGCFRGYESYEAYNFLAEAIPQSQELGPPTKYLTGPFTEHIREVISSIDERLEEINQGPHEITPGMVRYPDYMEEEDRLRFEALGTQSKWEWDDLRYFKSGALHKKGREILAPELAANPLTLGEVLNSPRHVAQTSDRSCSAATFSSIFSAITRVGIPVETVVGAAYNHGLTHKNGDDFSPVTDVGELLDTLRTPAFRQRYGCSCGRIPLIGAGFTQVADTVNRIRSKRPGSKIYMTVEVATQNLSPGVGVNHSRVVLGSDSEHVYTLDPSRDEYNPVMKTSVATFAGIWMEGYMRGNLVVTVPA